MAHFRIPKPVVSTLRLVVVVAPLVWIYSRVNFAALKQAIQAVAWWTVPWVVANTLAAMWLQGYRWWLLMRAFLRDLSLAKTETVHFKGLFYSIVLPTSAAQDVVRAALLSNRDDYPVVWGATWLCRLLGLFTLTALSLLGFFLIGPARLPSWLMVALLVAFVGLLLLSALSFSKAMTRRFRPLLAKFLPARIMRVVEEVRQSVYLYRTKTASVSVAFAVTLVVQLLLVCSAIVLVRGIVGSLFIKECLFFIPAIEMVVVSVPVTPNGMGLREALLSLFLLGFLGLTPEQLGIYVLIGLLGVVLRVVGGIPVAYEFFAKKDA